MSFSNRFVDLRPEAGYAHTLPVIKMDVGTMSLQSKKSFAVVDYQKCDPKGCDPQKGACLSASACVRKVLKQLDGRFEQPMVFQDLCMGCWDCMEACPRNAVQAMHVT